MEVVESSAGQFADYTRVESYFLATRKQQPRQWQHLSQRLLQYHQLLTAGLNFARVEVCNPPVHSVLVAAETFDLAVESGVDHFLGSAALPVVLPSCDVLGSLGVFGT